MWYKIRDEAKAFRENGEIQSTAPVSRKGGKRKAPLPGVDADNFGKIHFSFLR